jgi:hypothetical protein
MSHIEALEKVIQLLEQKVMKLELDLVNERLKNTQAPIGDQIVGPGIINTPYINPITQPQWWGTIATQPQTNGYMTLTQGAGTYAQTSQGAHGIHNQTAQLQANQTSRIIETQHGNIQLVPESQRNHG